MIRFLALIFALLASPAFAGLGDNTLAVSSNTTLTSAHKDYLVTIDASSAAVSVTLPAPASFGSGLILFKKIDTTSQLARLVLASGTFEQGQAQIPLSLEGDTALMHSDGSNWRLVSPGLATLRHNPWVAEHTITSTAYNIDVTYNGYVMLVDACTAGGSVLMILPSVTSAAFNHQTFSVKILVFDTCASRVVSIASQPNQPIHWSAATQIGSGSWIVNLTAKYQQIELWTDGARWVVLGAVGL